MKQTINTIFILLFIVLAYSTRSQTWPKYFGEPGKYDFSEDIIELYDMGYLLCGNIHDYSNGTSKNSWIIKTDINGSVLWEKIFDNDSHRSKINAVEHTNDGGVVICGSVRMVTGQAQPIVIKLNVCGEKEWCKIFYTLEDNPWAQDIKVTEAGDIVVLVNQFDQGPEETMHLFKLNPEGDVLWKKPYCSGYVHPEGAIPLGKKVMITSQNDYLITGEVYWEHPWNPGGAKPIRSVFVMVDSLGNEKWVLPFGLQDTIHGQGKNIYELNDNRFIGIANKWPIATMQTVFIEFDSLGNVLQYIIPDNEQIDTSFTRGVPLNFERIDTLYSLGGIYGNSEEAFSTEILLDTNIFTSIIAYNNYQHINEDEPYSMITTFDEKIISNSTFKETGNWDIALSKLNLNLEYDTLDPGAYTYDSLCTTPGLPQSGFIFLDDCDIVTGVDIPSPEEYYAGLEKIPVKAYPNPTTQGTITFEYENTEHHSNIELKCFGIYGDQVYSEKIYRYQGKSIVDVEMWIPGMYMAVIYSNGLPAGQAKFVVR